MWAVDWTEHPVPQYSHTPILPDPHTPIHRLQVQLFIAKTGGQWLSLCHVACGSFQVLTSASTAADVAGCPWSWNMHGQLQQRMLLGNKFAFTTG